jgi:hypothetical protein
MAQLVLAALDVDLQQVDALILQQVDALIAELGHQGAEGAVRLALADRPAVRRVGEHACRAGLPQ